jgi:transcriptional regulator with XRE-family HTH domain
VTRPAARGPRSSPASQLGARLARERTRQCKSMSDLARIAGTHASEISRLERGLRDPRLSTIVRLARALDVPVAVLVDGIDAVVGARV